MRIQRENNGLKVRAITGTRAVFLAFDADPAVRQGLRGFSIRRTEFWKGRDGEKRTSNKWLRVTKVFKSVDPRPKEADGGKNKVFRCDRHPIQKFFWADYGAQPGTAYIYEVFPAYGVTPAAVAPKMDGGVTLKLRTEVEDDGSHGIWFNRGAIASQYYAREIGNVPPTEAETLDVANIKTRWLSRRLLEACLEHIDGTGRGEHLHACLYEFTYAVVIDAFARAVERGVNVHIIFHATTANKDAVGTRLDGAEMIERTRPSIPHNKFIIRSGSDGVPDSVWTGSTNITMSGFLGQSNVGHLFHDATLAASYRRYWEILKDNPTGAPVKKATADISPQPGEVVPPNSLTPVFCARTDQSMLFWFANRMADARDLVMFTVAFTVSPLLIPVLARKRDCLRMLLMESRPPTDLAAAFAKSGRDRLLTTSYGAVLGKKSIVVRKPGGKQSVQKVDIEDFPLAEWLYREDHTRKEGFVFFVHTKYLLVDPLSDDPLVCTGSANFSKNSLENNDENMVLIRGDTRVADIYFTEFLRLHEHFYFRDTANALATKGSDEEGAFLEEKKDWTAGDYKPGTYRNARREMFFRDAGGSWNLEAAARPADQSSVLGRERVEQEREESRRKRKAKTEQGG